MSDNDTPSQDPTLPSEAPESPARPFDARAMAARRWATPGAPALDTAEGAREALQFLVKSGVREIRRLRRLGRPIPGLLISATSRPLEFLLSDSLARGDLQEVRKMLAGAKRRRG